MSFDPVDFRQLNDFQWQERMQALAQAVGLPDPYYRVQVGREGARINIGDRWIHNFASYDYLGLNGHDLVNAAAAAAIAQHGTSVSASRVVSGETDIHRALEREIAALYGVDDAIVMVSGHATNVTTIGQLLGAGDLLLYDAQAHNSIIVGGKLSRAKLMPFRHNDLDHLEALLTEERGNYRRCMIAVEGLYSMEGDLVALPRLVEIKKRHAAWLFVDEAHALGLVGERGFGIAEIFSTAGQDVDIWMGTLSKSLVSCGGYIAGSHPLVRTLRTSAPGFVYSVGIAPPLAAAASAALSLMKAEPHRVSAVQRQSQRLKQGAEAAGLDTGACAGSGIIPMKIGDSAQAVAWSHRLFERGVNALPIVFPAVPHDGAMLRFFVSASHTDEQIDETVELCRTTFDAVKSSRIGRSTASQTLRQSQR